MKIPKSLSQFKDTPTLFLVSGEFEAKFYVATDGEISDKDFFALDPREEAKEKQAFVGKKGGMQSLSAVSHHGRYIEDLKEKVLKKISAVVDDISYKENVRNIHIFAPAQTENRISGKLSKEAKDRIKDIHTGHYLKETPLFFIEMLKKDLEKERSTKHIHLSEDEKKIMHKPDTRPKKG